MLRRKKHFDLMILRRKINIRNVALALIVIALYTEYFVYRIQPWTWHQIECIDSQQCTKILLIADPQLQGELFTDPPLNHLFIWDSDRYLAHTFQVAINFFDPDIMIYLGDLMDEGSVANKFQYQHYLKRLVDIFTTEKPVVQIWVPGDNDIGGEHEPISKQRIQDFESSFQQPDVIEFETDDLLHKRIFFYKLNRIAHLMPKFPKDHVPDERNFNIIVSHYPVLGTGIFTQKAIEKLLPDLVVCGHDHVAKYVKSPKRSLYTKTTKELSSADGVLHIHFDNNTLYEIYVPTCSYRMGVNNMGYGAFLLEANNTQARYQVLWSSQRFPILFCYLFILIIIVLYIAIFYICGPLYRTLIYV